MPQILCGALGGEGRLIHELRWQSSWAQPTRSSNLILSRKVWGCLTLMVVDFYLIAKMELPRDILLIIPIISKQHENRFFWPILVDFLFLLSLWPQLLRLFCGGVGPLLPPLPFRVVHFMPSMLRKYSRWDIKSFKSYAISFCCCRKVPITKKSDQYCDPFLSLLKDSKSLVKF